MKVLATPCIYGKLLNFARPKRRIFKYYYVILLKESYIRAPLLSYLLKVLQKSKEMLNKPGFVFLSPICLAIQYYLSTVFRSTNFRTL